MKRGLIKFGWWLLAAAAAFGGLAALFRYVVGWQARVNGASTPTEWSAITAILCVIAATVMFYHAYLGEGAAEANTDPGGK